VIPPVPARSPYEQVAATVRAMIMAGDLAPGTQLPPTARLVEQFGVSNTTVQKALAVLKGEGYLVSRQGKGIYVRDRQPFRVEVAAFLPSSPGEYSYDILRTGEEIPPAEVARVFGTGPDGMVMLRHRLLRYQGSPEEAEWSYYPLSIVGGSPLARPGRVPGGAPQVLAELGYPERGFTDAVSARMPTPEEASLLLLPDVPVIRQFRVVYSDTDVPVEVSVLVKGAHLYELLYRQPVA
jgi:GntR family transcriptional regulator